MRIETTIFVEPIGKATARHTVRDGRVMTYTPARTRNTEIAIQLLIRQAVMEKLDNCFFPADVPLRLIAIFYRIPPKHLKKNITKPITRPDVDNYMKTLCDAMQKFLFLDDSQITTALIKKRFGTPPRIELILEEDDGA